MFPFLRVIARTYRTAFCGFSPRASVPPGTVLCSSLSCLQAVCAPSRTLGALSESRQGVGAENEGLLILFLVFQSKTCANTACSGLAFSTAPQTPSVKEKRTPHPIIRGHKTQCSWHPLFGDAVHQLELEADWEQREELPRQDKQGLFQLPVQQHH